jgi:transposase
MDHLLFLRRHLSVGCLVAQAELRCYSTQTHVITFVHQAHCSICFRHDGQSVSGAIKQIGDHRLGGQRFPYCRSAAGGDSGSVPCHGLSPSPSKGVGKRDLLAVDDLMNLEVDLLFFDTISSYFETEEESDLKKRGYSKDKRGDLPQVVIGLAVTRAGIPVKHWIFPGNTQDMKTIEHVKNDLSEWRLNRCIFVHDTGMTLESNLRYLQRGGHYIVGRKMKNSDAYAQEALSHKGPYTMIKEQLWAKEIVVGNGEKRKRLVLVRNDRERERAEKSREKLVTKLEGDIGKINAHKQKGKCKAAQKLKAHRVYGRYIKELKDSRPALNRTRLRSEARYDGKYLVESSDDTLSISDIVLGYKQLYDVEYAFAL